MFMLIRTLCCYKDTFCEILISDYQWRSSIFSKINHTIYDNLCVIFQIIHTESGGIFGFATWLIEGAERMLTVAWCVHTSGCSRENTLVVALRSVSTEQATSKDTFLRLLKGESEEGKVIVFI